jgi:hypothetical protein
MVYKTEISDVALKFEVAGGGSLERSKWQINEWEELTLTSTDKLVSSSQRI